MKKRSKSVIAMILAATLCFAPVCAALAAEGAGEKLTAEESALETEVEESDAQTEQESPSEDIEMGQQQDKEQEPVEEDAEDDISEEGDAEEQDVQEDSIDLSGETDPEQQDNKNAVEGIPDEVTEDIALEEDVEQERAEELLGESEPEQEEETGNPAAADAVGADVAQAIWTEGNTTLTFYRRSGRKEIPRSLFIMVRWSKLEIHLKVKKRRESGQVRIFFVRQMVRMDGLRMP